MDYTKSIIIIGIVIIGIAESGTYHQYPAQNFQDVLRDISSAYLETEETEDFQNFDQFFSPYPFNCSIMNRTNPTSVHRLTPADIDIVAAVGDSITAASGMKARSILFSSTQYRSDSWSIGGNALGLERGSLTLPNILKKYNPNLKGFSTGNGDWDDDKSNLNFAIPGSVSSDITDQVDRLIFELRNNSEYDFDNDWKLLTILIGGNDMCAACEDSAMFNPLAYRLNLNAALRKLYDNVPRMFVQFVPMFDISPIRNISTGQPCDFLHKLACPCAVFQDFRDPLKDFQMGYYDVIKSIVDAGRFEKEDFTVVLQPYLMDMEPLQTNGTLDFGFFAVDCFHPSQRGHRILAFELWKTMFQKVGLKERTIERIPGNFYNREHYYYCPGADEFITTANNSFNFPGNTPPEISHQLDEEIEAPVVRSKRTVMSMGDAIEALKEVINSEASPEPIQENYYDEIFHPENFTCTTFGKNPNRNLTVHNLTPADINIVAAVGDSITAGSGLGAQNIAGTAQEQRGRVWAMGGDGDGALDIGYLSLPNIIRQYNPNLKGASVLYGEWDSPEAGLNFAVPGAIAPLMPTQVRRLIDRLKSDPEFDFENDWKLFTMLIGGNDLCAACIDETVHNPRSYVASIQAALDMLQAEVPKMLVQIVPMFDVTDARKLADGMLCDFLQMLACPCARFEEFRDPHLRNLQLEYFDDLQDLIDTERYDTRDDFTVVIQPYFTEMKPLQLPGSNDLDLGFFAVDCFHPSWRGHRVMAFELWKNMFLTVGEKNMSIPEDFYDQTPHNYYCPSNDTFIQTNKNTGRLSDWLEEPKLKRKLKKRDVGPESVPKLPNISPFYMGNAVTAIKNLAAPGLTAPKNLAVPKPKQEKSSFHQYDDLFHPRDFNCDILPKTTGGPSSVHALRPGDIGLVAGIGDSITAGQGVGGDNIIAGAVEQRGRSWSMGGESTIEDGHLTLPNILKKYNPNLRGFSNGSGDWDDLQGNAGLNLAIGNAVSVLLPLQVQRLITRMTDLYPDAYDNEWKLLTVMIGRNDLCNQCEDIYYYSVDNFVQFVTEALDLAHQKIPKMLVQVVPTFDISSMRFMAKDMSCDFIQKLVCPCALYEDFREPLRSMQVQFYERMKEVIDGGRYDTRDDFTVVMQPFMVHDDPLTLPGTDDIDMGFYGNDCLQPSWRAHRVFALNAWESMFTPLERKKTKIPSNYYEYEHVYFCPTPENPYIKTYRNGGDVLPTTTTEGPSGGADSVRVGFITCALLLVTTLLGWTV